MATAVEIATANGLDNAQAAYNAAQLVGVPYYIACAFLEQESGGANVFGHDGGADGWFSGAGVVTYMKYKAYKAGRAAHGAQGVGPMQLTWPPYQDEADALGGCWKVSVNIRHGLTILKGFVDSGDTWHEAARRYNGSETYAVQVSARIVRWKHLLAYAGGEMVTAYTRIPIQTDNGPGVINDRTRQMLHKAEGMLGYELSIVQGSYTSQNPGSAGTHDGGGVVDLRPYDWENKVRVLRTVGFAAWHRTPDQGDWGEHIHAVALSDAEASPAAKAQMVDYRNHRNGLASHAPDNTWRPDPIHVYRYRPQQPQPPKEPPADPPGSGHPLADEWRRTTHALSLAAAAARDAGQAFTAAHPSMPAYRALAAQQAAAATEHNAEAAAIRKLTD